MKPLDDAVEGCDEFQLIFHNRVIEHIFPGQKGLLYISVFPSTRLTSLHSKCVPQKTIVPVNLTVLGNLRNIHLLSRLLWVAPQSFR